MYRRVWWVWCACVLCTVGFAWSAEYQVIDLGPMATTFDMPLSEVGLRPEAISAEGHVAGWKPNPTDTLQYHHSFVRWATGEVVYIPAGAGDYSHATGISGDTVVGWGANGGIQPRGAQPYIWTPTTGARRLADPPGFPVPFRWGLRAFAVNAHGTVAGRGFDGLGEQVVVWVEGQPLTIAQRDWSALNQHPLIVEALNTSGIVVGGLDGHATRWTADGATRLDAPDTLSSVAKAINDNGTITGSFETSAGTTQAFVWLEGGRLHPLAVAPSCFSLRLRVWLHARGARGYGDAAARGVAQ